MHYAGKRVAAVCDKEFKTTHKNRDHIMFLEQRHVYIAAFAHLDPVTAEADMRPTERGEF